MADDESPSSQAQSQGPTPEASLPASPTDNRHPLARVETAAALDNNELGESYKSSDTVRQKPETQPPFTGYGKKDYPRPSPSLCCHVVY